MKQEIKELRKESSFKRREAKTKLQNYYFNLFMNKYEVEGDIDYQAKEWLFKIAWCEGKIACFPYAKGVTDLRPNGEPIFTTFAPFEWNIYDYPINVNLINRRGVKFIPSKLMKVDKDVVICYFLKSRKTIKEYVDYLIDKIVDLEMLMKVSQQSLKMPFLVAVSPEDKARMENLVDAIINDNVAIYGDFKDFNAIKVLNNSNQFILDKIKTLIGEYHSEIRTYLGIDNVDSNKKEHLIVDEVNANNEIINQCDDIFFDAIDDFFKRINELFGYNLTIKKKYKDVVATDEIYEEVEDDDNNQ